MSTQVRRLLEVMIDTGLPGRDAAQLLRPWRPPQINRDISHRHAVDHAFGSLTQSGHTQQDEHGRYVVVGREVLMHGGVARRGRVARRRAVGAAHADQRRVAGILLRSPLPR